MRRAAVSTAIGFICGFAALLAADRMAFPQAGSAGGTIGKHDKSISGDEEAPSAFPSDRKKPHTRSAKPNEGAYSACGAANIEGNWNSSGLSENIRRTGCDFLAKVPGSIFNHIVKGRYSGSSNYSLTITRTNQITGCTTMMFGSMTLISEAEFRTVIASTDGKCDLAVNFTETRTWTR
jgi:hypothetical protein